MVRHKQQQRKASGSNVEVAHEFHFDYLNPSQELAWRAFERHDVLFMLGPAGTGKTHLATAFAVRDLLEKKKERIVVTRPVVESGESLGFLPGDLNEKIMPYMMPIYDCLNKTVGRASADRDRIRASMEVVPLAYMRGRTFDDAVFILDEAQNCTHDQIKLAISRLGRHSKMIITGDPQQSDLPGRVALEDVVAKVGPISGVGVIRFQESDIVRHSLIAKILKEL